MSQIDKLRKVLKYHRANTPKNRRRESKLIRNRYDIADRNEIRKLRSQNYKKEGDPNIIEEIEEEEKKEKFRRHKKKKKSFTFVTEDMVKKQEEEAEKKQTFIGKIFFTNFSRLFDAGSKRPLKQSDLFSLPKGARCENLVKNFDDLSTINGIQLARNLFRLVKKPMVYAIILRILEQGLGVIMPFLMAYFLKLIKVEEDKDYTRIFMCVGLAVVITMLKSILGEHSSRYTCSIMSQTGQTLRGIFYSHIMTANYSFLKNADTSFIAKMSIYEFDAIIKFMGNIPKIASFPITFILVLTLIILQVGSSSLVLLVVFVLASLFLAYLDHKMLKMNKKYKKIGSKRTLILTEMLTDMRAVKINSWEVYFYKKLKQVRNNEITVLNKLSLDRAISNSVFFLTPILCSALIIFFEHKKNQQTLDVAVAFAIVSVLNQLQKPLNVLSSSVDLYIDFKIGHKSLSRFFNSITQKPQDYNNKPWLGLGEIRVFDCTGCLEDDLVTHKKIDKIFGIREKMENKDGDKGKEEATKSNKDSKKTKDTKDEEEKKGSQNSKQVSQYKQKSKTGIVKRRKKKLNSQGKQDYLAVKKVMDDNVKSNNLDQLKYGGPLRSHHQRLSRSRRSISRFSRGNSIRSRSRRKIVTGTSKITNLVQIIQNSNRMVSMNIDKTGEKSKLRMVHMDLSFDCRPGQKICLMGRNNSGCSELLLTISGETIVTQGTCEVNGSISYIDLKNPFFVNSLSLKQNITLDAPGFNTRRYLEVIKISELNLKKFAGEDQVEVIENGRNFSSGERRKILLARFLYQDNDIYLFDHYFDEFDTKEHLNHFHRVVKEFLKDKTVIYLSRKEEFVKEADHIYVFDNGNSVEHGTYDQLKNSSKRYFRELLIKTDLHVDKHKSSKFRNWVKKAFVTKISNTAGNDIKPATKLGVLNFLKLARKGKRSSKVDKEFFAELFSAIGTVQMKRELGKVTSEKEEKVTQTLPYLTNKYLFILGKGRIIALLLLFFTTVMGFIAADIWLGIWSTNTISNMNFFDYFKVYGIICTVTVVLVILRDIIYHKILRMNSDSLHFKMLEKFFNTAMLWFIKNPSSRVTFRMTRDQRVIDETLNDILQQFFDASIIVIGGLLILNIIYFGVMAIITIIIIYSLYRILNKFFKVTHSIAQMQAEKKAQLQAIYFRAMTDSLHFRSLTMLDILRDKFMLATNGYQQLTTHLSFFSQRWLGMRLMWVQVFMMFCAFALPFTINEYFSEIYFKQKWQFAFAISWSLKIIEHTTNLVHKFSNTVLHMISVGRILNYLKHEYEEDTKEERNTLLPLKFNNDIEYPIVLKEATLKYGERVVLNQINLKIKARARLAVFGTSGSGKHSLMNLIVGIFKRDAGSLEVFGRKIDTILKNDIRELSFYVSGTPMLFAGNVRENIDPDYRYDDMDLIKVLAYVGFYDLIKINTASLKDLKEWEMIQNNPEKRLTIMLNLANFIAEAENIKSRRSIKSSKRSIRSMKKRRRHVQLYNHLYEGLVGDMLSDYKFVQKYRDTPLSRFMESQHENMNQSDDFIQSKKKKASFSGRHIMSQNFPNSRPDIRINNESVYSEASSFDKGSNRMDRSQLSNFHKENEMKKNPEKKYDSDSNNNLLNPLSNILNKRVPLSQNNDTEKVASINFPEMNKNVRIANGENIMIHQVANLPKLEDFSLETLTDKSGEESIEFKTISNFLKMKVLSKGGNIPWNMRKLIILAKAFIEEPYLLFFDENSLQMGYKKSFSKNFRKIKSNFNNSMMVGFLQSLSNINEFEEVILMEDGRITEQGQVEKLVLDDNSLLSRKLKAEDEKLWAALREAIREKNRNVSMVVREYTYGNISSGSEFSDEEIINEEEYHMNYSPNKSHKSHKKSSMYQSGKSVVIEEEILHMSNSLPGSILRSQSKSRKSSGKRKDFFEIEMKSDIGESSDSLNSLSENISIGRDDHFEIISRGILKSPGRNLFSRLKSKSHKNLTYLSPNPINDEIKPEFKKRKRAESFTLREAPKLNKLCKLPLSKGDMEDLGLQEPEIGSREVIFPFNLEQA